MGDTLPDHFSFTLQKSSGAARAGIMHTPHGAVQTPIFMPVGTLATVKSLDSDDLIAAQAEIILANTYHLYLRPGTDLLEKAGGVHEFMQWDRPILTDSGGFQVFSLGKQLAGKSNGLKPALRPARIDENGVSFYSHLDGSEHRLTPQKAIAIQRSIGADIIMAFDECTPEGETERYTRQALDRTHRWAIECVEHWEEQGRVSAYGKYQALFGIVQGALFKEMRQESARFMANLPFDGIAVGGETVGYNMQGTADVMGWIAADLPQEKPRYAMGLGRDPQNLIDAVLLGFDMFDCVGPTRLARNGALYHGEFVVSGGVPRFESEYPRGRLQIGQAQYKTGNGPISSTCGCAVCQKGYSRAYLHHLYKTKELSYYRLASIHNIYTMVNLSRTLREWIMRGSMEGA